MFAVCQRVCSQQHTLSGVTLNVTMLESQPNVNICAVQVSGILPTHSCDFISLYFESKKWSGGGKIDDVFDDREDGIAVITFASADSMNIFCHVLLLMFFCFCYLCCFISVNCLHTDAWS